MPVAWALWNINYKLMWTTLRQRISEKWGLIRIVKLVIAIYLIYISIETADFLPGFVGAILIFQAIYNQPLCRACTKGNCNFPQN